MSLFRELSYDGAEIDDIESIQFCLLDPEEIRRRSVVEVQTTDTYVGNEPVLNGLYDPRMGVTDASRLCGTCEQRSVFCPGHFGHIEMAQPIFYYQYMGFIKKILQMVCIKCSRLMYDVNTPEMQSIIKRSHRIHRWNNVHKLCSKVVVCGQHNKDGCGGRNPDKVVKNSIKGFTLEWKAGVLEDDSLRKQNFGAPEVLEILRRITDQDIEAMGMSPKYSRPEWMICTVLPVPPPAVRPCVHHETGQRQEDDLSYTLGHIIKNNNMLAAKIKKNDKKEYIDGYALQLQYYVATLVENQIQGITPPTHKRSGRTLRSLSDRLKGKEGRIRGNLMGKRVDFSARSVITPDPNISIDEVGVPMRIAKNLTFPETVSALNRDALQRMVVNGPDVYPGAKMVRKTKEGGRIISLKKVLDRTAIRLDDGDIVERHLLNGDYVLFNRQPSLHRMSMMGHRVRVMPFNTFRISTSVCTSFNADFDGDEMNMHVPQSHTTAVELERLASVNSQIVSPKNSKPIISIVQDTVLGIWRMTQPHVRVDRATMYNMLSVLSKIGRIPDPHEYVDGEPYWTGRQLLSCVIPSKVTISMKNSQGELVRIVNGEILDGVIDARVYQAMTKGLVHSTFVECGKDVTRDLFDDTQKLACAWLVRTGFSVGVSDLIADDEVKRYVKQATQEMKQRVYSMMYDVHAGRFANPELTSDGQYFESQINNTLNSVVVPSSEAVSKMLQEQEGNNRMLNMIVSGSKGKLWNMNQMVAFLGQQNVEGHRVSEGFDNRTLPHFTRFDDGPDAKGWVQNSFYSGLSPVEFFFHAMGGRDGLIDSACKSVTADTEIVIIEDGVPKQLRIGDWIDAHLESRPKSIKHYPEDRNMELLELENKVFIPTCDEKGVTSWGELTAVTRHDPGERLYKIETKGGRSVTVAESKSLLIWNESDQKFEAKNSPDVKIGDSVPVTAFLPEPPVVIQYVDMQQYFPKTKYVHGTEFNRACTLMQEAQGDKYFIPKGWWAENNGTAFTLPFTKKASLQRTTVRSQLENILDGHIYPYRGPRNCGRIPDKFQLDYDNGVFIGLFLADGNTDTPAGSLQISKQDPDVQEVVRKWFDKHGITHRTVKQQKRLGFSYGVVGSSMLLARFLDEFVGVGARNKRVPDVAFAAPLEFVKGLLSGYFSGDGTIGSESVSSSSTSYVLNRGIAMLCSRLGIYCRNSVTQQKWNNLGTEDIAPMHHCMIRCHWGQIFKESVELIGEKGVKLLDSEYGGKRSTVKEQEDVILDPIRFIEVLDVKDHPKLYDVTVPSTLNFGLANGLCNHDTSEIGYLQRKLVKAMEDCKVHYDLSVRNASGQVVQFLYGEDGMDCTRIERQKIVYSGMDPMQFAMTYSIGDPETDFGGAMKGATMDALMQRKDWKDLTNKHFMQVVADRELLFSKMFPRVAGQPDEVLYPVAFDRILSMSHAMTFVPGQVSDLDPVYAIEKLDDLVSDVPILRDSCSKMFGILVRMYLSPKRLVCKYRMTRAQFDNVLAIVRARHMDSIAHAGEMVGVVAAQSIGEPLTQCTLNSFHVSGTTNTTVTGGVPRIRELLSATRRIKTPSMTIIPSAGIRHDKITCNRLLNRIQMLKLSQLVSRTRIFFDPSDSATVIPEDEGLLSEYAKYSEIADSCQTEVDPRNPWVLRMDVDREAMVERGVTMFEIADAIIEAHEHRVRCVFSDESDANLVFRLRLDKPETEDALTELRAFESHLLDNLVIWGVKGVDRVTMNERNVTRYRNTTKSYEQVKEWHLYTAGTDLRAILGRNGIDSSYTVTNDVVEIYEILGIEAARQALIDEFNAVMTEGDINFRHVSLLVDNMTHRGRITSVDRFGINRSDIGVLSKASFEESVEQIITSAVFAEKDPVTSVAANVMLGQIAPCGTGQTNLAFDIKQFVKIADSLGISTSSNDLIPFDKEDDEDGESTTDDVASDLIGKSSVVVLHPSLVRLNLPVVPTSRQAVIFTMPTVIVQ